MTQEEFERKQAAMSDKELIELADKQVVELARTGGRSHRMCVPPMITDTDMIFSQLIKRFEKKIEHPTYTEAQIREACEAIGLVDYGINKLLTKLKEK